MLKLLAKLMKKNEPGAGELLSEASYISVDTELTGLDDRRDSIVSIGAVKMTGGRIELGDTFYRLVRPETVLRAESVVIHEITPSEVSDQPDIKTVLEEFVDFCSDAVLAGFCLDIDMDFLQRASKRAFGRPFPNMALDIYPLFEMLKKKGALKGDGAPPEGRYTLHAMARYLGVDPSGAHNALMDAFVAAQVLQRLIPLLENTGILTVGEALNHINKFRGGDEIRRNGIAVF